MNIPFPSIAVVLLATALLVGNSQPARSNESSPPYGLPTAGNIRTTLDRVRTYLEQATPVFITDAQTGLPVADLKNLPANPQLGRDIYSLTSYEWGVTYAGMLLAAKALDDPRYRDYAATRLGAIAAVAERQRARLSSGVTGRVPLQSILQPRDLDHAGSLGAAMAQAARDGIEPTALRPCIDTALQWITTGQSRLADGAFDRDFPFPHTLWLDDLYMSVPALAQMGALTGERRYFDDAVRQITQFSERMFLPGRDLYMHSWVEGMDPHPAFPWARANGWANMAMAELLTLLPDDHPGRAEVLKIYRAHAAALAALQSPEGRWHQLLDRPGTYLETSASAIFIYAIARGVNRGWLDASAYGPMLALGWNALAPQVNATGQIEGVCIGTGVGYDPAFYARRPTSLRAAHGYGPMLLAGAEMVTLLENHPGRYEGDARALGVQFPAPKSP